VTLVNAGLATDVEEDWALFRASGVSTSEPLRADLPNCELSHTLAPFSLCRPVKQVCCGAVAVRQ